MAYIDVPIDTEPVDLAEEAFAYLEQQVPGWLPSPGNLEAWLVEALAQTASELRELCSLVPDSIFQYFGETILGFPPYPAVQAQASTTWTAVDSAGGYTVPAGTLVAINPPASMDAYAFQVVEQFQFPAGQQTVTGVQIQALEAGAAASGQSGSVELLDPLVFVDAVVLEGPTSGGSDAEPIDAYLDRLSSYLTLLTPRPILPNDFALLASTLNPAVARATAIDLYNAQTGQSDVPRCVTVAIADLDGNPVPAQVRADVDALLQSMREVNFLVFVIDPTYTTVDVQFTVAVWPGYDPAQVAALAVQNLQAYLSPARWGQPPFGNPGGTQSWLNIPIVRLSEVSEQLNRTDGVWWVVDLQIGPGGGPLGTNDVPLAGVAPLPQPGAIAGTGQAGS
jgi:hypothetical protein